mgnify:CR=1 FL=1
MCFVKSELFKNRPLKFLFVMYIMYICNMLVSKHCIFTGEKENKEMDAGLSYVDSDLDSSNNDDSDQKEIDEIEVERES